MAATKTKPRKTTPATPNGFPTVEADADLAGEMVAWDLAAMQVQYRDVCEALEAAGFDPSTARRMLPRNAFARACRALAEKKLVRTVDEDEDTIRFQFTDEFRTDDGLEYHRAAVLSLDKSSGAVTADDPDLAERARDAIDEQMGLRRTSDITRLIHTLCDRQREATLDLTPIGKGGTYWVRVEGRDWVDKTEAFVTRLGGSMIRLPIARPRPNTTAAANLRDAVAAKIGGLLNELNLAVDGFDDDARNKSLNAAADRAKTIRLKIEAYRDYLEDERDRLGDELTAAIGKLRAKVAEVMQARAED